LATQFSAAYDVYLEIQRRVNAEVYKALGYDTPNWKLLNICPPCYYKLEDEPELKFSSFVTMDGNNSLKRWGASMHNQAARIDTRTLESDRWLEAEEVNRFADEVKGKKKVCRIPIL
jgi:hypothetical protein